MGRGRKVEGVLSELPEPTETQTIVKVSGIPGGNLVQVVDAEDRTFLCRIPAKFRNVIWIKIGGYLIVEREVEASDDDAPKVQATLAHYMYRDQIRHLQNRKLWPPEFEQGDAAINSTGDEYGASELRANTNHDFRDLPASSGEGEDEDSEGEEEPAVDALGNTIMHGESSDDGEGRQQST